MKKGMLIFRISICVVLVLSIAASIVLGVELSKVAKNQKERESQSLGILVAGVSITEKNASDVMGDGKVQYDVQQNLLTFDNVLLDSETYAIRSNKDLTVNLIGENKFIGRGAKGCISIFVSDDMNRKDLYIKGTGTLEIQVENEDGALSAGIVADSILIESNVKIALSGAESTSTAVECNNLILSYGAKLSAEVGAAMVSTGICVRGNMQMESETQLDVSFKEGEVGTSYGIYSRGLVHLYMYSALKIKGATTASFARGIDTSGNMILEESAILDVTSGGEAEGIICYGSVADFGAILKTTVKALCNVHYVGHEWKNQTTLYDEYGHWLKCECGYEGIYEPHDWENGTVHYDQDGHWVECICGFHSEKEPHENGDECECGVGKE